MTTCPKGAALNRRAQRSASEVRTDAPLTKTQRDSFIDTLAQAARRCRQSFRVLPSILIALAILDSDWGQSAVARTRHIYFSAFGKRVKFANAADCFLARARSLDKHTQFIAACERGKLRDAAAELVIAGELTDDSYRRLLDAISKNDLARFDKEKAA